MRNSTALLFAFVSGAVLSCAYPPVGLGFLAYGALVPMLFIMHDQPPGKVLCYSFFSGLVFHALTLNWIRHITWVGMIAAVLILAVFYSLPFIIARLVRMTLPRFWLFLFPFMVAGIEWFRSFDTLAFPWMIMGNSQTSYPFLIQFADITSAFGVSFWVVAVNVAVYLLIRRRSPVRWGCLLALFVIPLLYSHIVMRLPDGDTQAVNVAIIQGNVSPEEKWGSGNEMWNINLYLDMTREAMAFKPDLVVWPETAVPVYLCEWPRFRSMVQALVDSSGVPLLTGTPAIDYASGDTWNAAAFFLPGDYEVQVYKKMHLVPFGEKVPLSGYFPFLENFELGQANWAVGTQPVVFTARHIPPFHVPICFESIFPDLNRAFVVRGSRFIMVITNDVWFGPFASPIQHAMIAVMRAIEFHQPVVRCANTGISMLIDHHGIVRSRTKTFERDILYGTIHPGAGTTFYARFGNVFSIFCFGITMISLAYYFTMKYRGRHSYP